MGLAARAEQRRRRFRSGRRRLGPVRDGALWACRFGEQAIADLFEPSDLRPQRLAQIGLLESLGLEKQPAGSRRR